MCCTAFLRPQSLASLVTLPPQFATSIEFVLKYGDPHSRVQRRTSLVKPKPVEVCLMSTRWCRCMAWNFGVFMALLVVLHAGAAFSGSPDQGEQRAAP